MNSLKFGNLPTLDGREGWLAEAGQLRENPGQWALLTAKSTRNSAAQMAYRIRRALLSCFQPAGSFEAVARGTEVWCRFVGGDPS